MTKKITPAHTGSGETTAARSESGHSEEKRSFGSFCLFCKQKRQLQLSLRVRITTVEVSYTIHTKDITNEGAVKPLPLKYRLGVSCPSLSYVAEMPLYLFSMHKEGSTQELIRLNTVSRIAKTLLRFLFKFQF